MRVEDGLELVMTIVDGLSILGVLCFMRFFFF